ncbi:uncharacterized protein LOC135695407 [Rhopilema esculentum]|uniref:uncharacterized protein LOC135695407 n=1 Tax=Rhopilema esculentum TaxID=499914 RepID=UPI0031E435D2|eukprot:gene11591-21828_t
MKSSKKKVKNLPPGQTRSRSSVSRLHKDGSLHAVHSTHSMSQVRLQLFREAFHMIDQDRDGIISKDDLKGVYESLGAHMAENKLEEMLNEVSGPMNHSKFTIMMASRAGDMDDTQVLLQAFSILDVDGTGLIPVKKFCKLLRTVGYERMTHEEINAMLKVAPVDGLGQLNYRTFVQMIRGEI